MCRRIQATSNMTTSTQYPLNVINIQNKMSSFMQIKNTNEIMKLTWHGLYTISSFGLWMLGTVTCRGNVTIVGAIYLYFFWHLNRSLLNSMTVSINYNYLPYTWSIIQCFMWLILGARNKLCAVCTKQRRLVLFLESYPLTQKSACYIVICHYFHGSI